VLRLFIACGIFTLLGFACPALAHVTAHPDAGVAGSYFETRFIVPHGCNGSPTIALRITIPDGIAGVTPQMKPGWKVSIRRRKLEQPLSQNHGKPIIGGVAEVEWRGGPLPNDLYDAFGLMMKLPTTSGRTLYFPVTQECRNGIRRWTGIPANGQPWHDLPSPAPFVKLLPQEAR
jgi:uncharacterized protein YcnI